TVSTIPLILNSRMPKMRATNAKATAISAKRAVGIIVMTNEVTQRMLTISDIVPKSFELKTIGLELLFPSTVGGMGVDREYPPGIGVAAQPCTFACGLTSGGIDLGEDPGVAERIMLGSFANAL